MLLLCISLCLTGCESKGYTWLESVNIVAMLTAEGDLVVSETWHAVITEDEVRNLYREISVKDPEFPGVAVEVTDVSVQDGDGTEYTELINPENPSWDNANRRAQNKYYVYDYGNSKLELGCYFAPTEYSSKQVTFNYTLRNMARAHDDCVELYWAVIAEDFSLYIEDIEVSLMLPDGTRVDDSAYFWLHTESEESYSRNDTDKISFGAQNLSEDYFEIRALMPGKLFGEVTKESNKAVKADIIAQEYAEYEAYMAELKKRSDLGIVSIVLSCILAVGGVAFAVLYPKHYKKSKGEYPEYVREIPEELTAAQAGHFFYYYTGGGKGAKNRNKLMSATILDLARRGFIDIEPGADNKDYTLSVPEIADSKSSELRTHEETLLNLIRRVEAHFGHPFTMNEFTLYSRREYDDVNNTLNSFLSESEALLRNGGYVCNEKSAPVFTAVGIISIIIGIALLINGKYMNFMGPGLAVMGALITIFTPKVPKLNQNGEEKYELTQGLKRFMLDFTNLREHELPALVLWEAYMVYATMMGISEAVLKNLKLKYPELTSEENPPGGYYYGRRNFIFTYYMLSGRASYDLGRSLDNCFTNVSATAKAIQMSKSSGSGKGGSFGGGFGHGGGGFGGGGGGFGGGGGGAR